MYQPPLFFHQTNQVNMIPHQYMYYVPQNQYLQLGQNQMPVFPGQPITEFRNQIINPNMQQVSMLQQLNDIKFADYHQNAGVQIYHPNYNPTQNQHKVDNDQNVSSQNHQNQRISQQGMIKTEEEQYANNQQIEQERVLQYKFNQSESRFIQDQSNTYQKSLETSSYEKMQQTKLDDEEDKEKSLKKKRLRAGKKQLQTAQCKEEEREFQSNLNKQSQQNEKITTTWKYVKFDTENQSLQELPIISSQNETKLQQKNNYKIKMKSSQVKINIVKQECEKFQQNFKVEETQEGEKLTEDNQIVDSKISGTDQQDNKQDQGQINGNLCKNLMRAFNKFAQNYDFKDPSVKISLFRFLERNTYSNLQMLKIYHNPRYQNIFLEFVQGGALMWLQKSKVIDTNAHIALLEKIIQGDISMIGIKKRKNVSKTITKNLKKKRLSNKKY